MKILCIGNISYDITFPIENFPEENTKNRLTTKVECGGGPASTAAYLLAKWGLDVYFAGIVGNDLYGNRIKEEFKEIGVNTTYLQTSNEYETRTAFILANTVNGTRTVYSYKNELMTLKPFETDFKPDLIYLDGQDEKIANYYLDKYKDSVSVIDAGRSTKEVIDLCHKVTYIVSSKQFAEEVTNIKIDYNNFDTLKKLYNKMVEIFKKDVYVTLEEKGCLIKFNDEIIIVPSIKVEPLDSTGAGDIFHGAFTYGVVKGFDKYNLVRVANITGAISVTRLGGRHSVPPLEEVIDVYNRSK